MNSTVGGRLTYETKLDTSGYQKGINDITSKTKSGGATVKNIVAGLGITKLVTKAFDTIRSSMDGAISRLDTMNNFPKVMSNLGIGAKESQKAINKLSEGLQGIPTSLDAGALAVQRFTSKNGDVQKSADIFLAVNDAILAGGASTEIQASALEQLSQAYSKGKMDMMEWRTLQTAMPAQLKQVASAMGLTTDQLGEMLRTGDDTEKVFDEFVNTIIRMDKTGVKGFKSLKEQARNATGGIQTSIANMKTAITRGVAGMIQEFDKVLKNKGFGGISGIITTIGKEAEKALKSLAGYLPKVINLISGAFNILNKLKPVILAVISALVLYKTTLIAIQAINVVGGIIKTVSAFVSLIPAIRSAKDAMLLLNMAFNANPVGLIVAGIGALTTALLVFGNKQKEVKSATKDLVDSLDEYDKKMNEIAKNRKEAIKDGEAEIYSYQRLYSELQMIVDENGKVKEGYEEKAELITGKLSQALGVEINLIDGQIQNYGELKASVEEAIKAKKAEILLNAYEEEYTEALKKRKDIQSAYTKALQENQQAHEQYNRTYQAYVDAVNSGSSSMFKLRTELEIMGKAVEDSDSKLAKAGDTLNNNQEKISQYELGLDALANKNYEAVEKIYNDTVEFNGKTKEANDEKYNYERMSLEAQLSNLQQNRQKYDEETYQRMEKAYKDQIELLDKNHQEANKKLEYQNEVTKKTTLDGINQQLKVLTDHQYEFKQASDGNMKLYIDGMEQEKTVSYNKMQEIVNGTIAQINSKRGDSESAGRYLTEGLGIGIESGRWGVLGKINSLTADIMTKLRKGLDEHSPSKTAKQYGKWLDEGLYLGIEEESNKVLNSVDNLSDDIVDRMKNAVNIQTGKMAFSGTAGSVNQILTATGTTTVINENKLLLDGDVVYENQKKVSARKNLQTQFGGAYNVSN